MNYTLFPFLSLLLFAPLANAINGFIDPNGDGTVTASPNRCPRNQGNYVCLDDGLRDPALPEIIDTIRMNDGNVDFYDLSTLAGVGIVTSISVHTFHYESGNNMRMELALYDANETVAYAPFSRVNYSAGGQWDSIDFTNLTLWSHDLNDLKVAVRCVNALGGKSQRCDNFAMYALVTFSPPYLGASIVDSLGATVVSPLVQFSTTAFSYDAQSTTATLPNGSQRIRVTNTTGSAPWSLTLAASNGPTARWVDSMLGVNYDYNDSPLLGQLTVDPTSSVIVSVFGNTTLNGISSGSRSSFLENSIDSITLFSAGPSADPSGIWDVSNINLTQEIPPAQAPGNYSIEFTLTAA